MPQIIMKMSLLGDTKHLLECQIPKFLHCSSASILLYFQQDTYCMRRLLNMILLLFWSYSPFLLTLLPQMLLPSNSLEPYSSLGMPCKSSKIVCGMLRLILIYVFTVMLLLMLFSFYLTVYLTQRLRVAT